MNRPHLIEYDPANMGFYVHGIGEVVGKEEVTALEIPVNLATGAVFRMALAKRWRRDQQDLMRWADDGGFVS